MWISKAAWDRLSSELDRLARQNDVLVKLVAESKGLVVGLDGKTGVVRRRVSVRDLELEAERAVRDAADRQ